MRAVPSAGSAGAIIALVVGPFPSGAQTTAGDSTLLDLLASQTTLDNARAALIQARQDYRVGRAQIEAIIGRDLS